MIIDNENLVILIEVMKTGTTFIRRNVKSLGIPNDIFISSNISERHLPLSHIFNHSALKYDPKKYDIFMFTRHPEDFFVSEFFEYKNNNIIPYLNNALFKNPHTDAMKNYMKKLHSRYKFFKEEDAFDLNKNLHSLLSDDNFQHFPKRLVNIKSIFKHYLDVEIEESKLHICKYENFKDSIDKFFKAIKKPIPNINKRVNVSQKNQKINRENRALINEIFDYDFKKYGYFKRSIYSTI